MGLNGVTPFQGLRILIHQYPGLAPWAFVLRPVGACFDWHFLSSFESPLSLELS